MGSNKIRNFIIGAIFLAFIAGGVGVSLYVVNQNQDIRDQASTSTGTASVSISPTSGDIPVGGSLPVSFSFNAAGGIISTIAIRATYPYSGDLPQLTAENFVIDPDLLASGDWSCPVKKFEAVSGTANIDIACVNTSTSGYSSTGVIKLATVSLTAASSATNGTYTVTFDPKLSIITKKLDSADVLLTPSSQGTYTIIGGTTSTVTPTPTLTPTPTATPTPTPIAKRYRCSTYSCIEDNVYGTYSTANCNNACLQPQSSSGDRALPRTGNPLITIGIIAVGISLISLAAILL